jgi:hypothetical protein
MSALLDDIIKLAIDGNQPLPDILRKCLLLGHELKNVRLKAWANQELNGYQSGKDVPEYRIIPAQARGNFIGPFHSQYNGHIIPPAVLENEHRDFAERVYLIQSVSAFEDVTKGAKQSQGSLVFDWPADMVVYYQEKLMQGGFICHSAWQEIPPSALVELLDTVRNRTLNMALEIKDELGTSYTDLRQIKSKDAATSIQNIIFQNTGGSANVAFDGSSIDASTNTEIVINVGDKNKLAEILGKAGLSNTDVRSLTEAFKADGEKQPGTKVGAWVKDNASKVVMGGVKIGAKIGGELLSAWLKQYYGL